MPCDVFSNLLHSVTLPIDVHSDTLFGECCLGDSLLLGFWSALLGVLFCIICTMSCCEQRVVSCAQCCLLQAVSKNFHGAEQRSH